MDMPSFLLTVRDDARETEYTSTFEGDHRWLRSTEVWNTSRSNLNDRLRCFALYRSIRWRQFMKEYQNSPAEPGRRIVVKEIKAVGYYDEAGRFRLLSCVGKITPLKDAAMTTEKQDMNKRVA